MKLYAHWLDGEYLWITKRALQIEDVDPLPHIESFLKLHALLGNSFLLSDVQVTDCSITQYLFLDPGFREFIRGLPSFLGLVSSPGTHGTGENFRRAIAGLLKADREDWWPSSFADRNRDPLKELLHSVLADGYINPSEQLNAGSRVDGVMKNWGKYSDQLKGILFAMNHFANPAPGVIAEDPKKGLSKKSYYEVLNDVRDKDALSGEERGYIEKTINFIDNNVEDPNKRHRRSEILQHISLFPGTEDEHIIWNTIVQAWNPAVQLTISPDGGSISGLPKSTPVGKYIFGLADHLSPMEVVDDNMTLKKIEGGIWKWLIRWDINSISWYEILRVCDQTAETARKLQEAQGGDPKLVEYLITRHVDALARQLLPYQAPPPWQLWYFWLGSAVGAVSAASHDPALGAAAISLTFPRRLSEAKQLLRRQAAATVLHRAATLSVSKGEAR